MACVTIPPDIQGCLNIPLIRGDDKTITLECNDGDGNPIDLSAYGILMEARNPSGGAVIQQWIPGKGFEINGNDLNIVFDNADPLYQQPYTALSYDIAFTLGDLTEHWIKGQIIFTKSETDTWTS